MNLLFNHIESSTESKSSFLCLVQDIRVSVKQTAVQEHRSARLGHDIVENLPNI